MAAHASSTHVHATASTISRNNPVGVIQDGRSQERGVTSEKPVFEQKKPALFGSLVSPGLHYCHLSRGVITRQCRATWSASAYSHFYAPLPHRCFSVLYRRN